MVSMGPTSNLILKLASFTTLTILVLRYWLSYFSAFFLSTSSLSWYYLSCAYIYVILLAFSSELYMYILLLQLLLSSYPFSSSMWSIEQSKVIRKLYVSIDCLIAEARSFRLCTTVIFISFIHSTPSILLTLYPFLYSFPILLNAIS